MCNNNEGSNLEFINATKVIGEVLVCQHLLSDSWLKYRVRSLIHSNQLTYEGNLQSTRMNKIKTRRLSNNENLLF
ncbi:DUF3658 domain-containing protein [Salipaludibacillus sp. HK11]|uniref:DUF3658 domain-containing protein n=1 Tax=Salipaludibacillus sp. HK11 TaxID=3394320 RepID=UPI0039FCB74F